jgi:single-strand selective monofunctional uracil DNA glycosylase
LWGWARETFKTPERFFARFFVANYCPLVFMESTGRNRTPNNLPAAERRPLLAVCDKALRKTIEWIKPRYVVGIGKFAEERAQIALSGLDVTIGHITHPSPANPQANKGWASLVMRDLSATGIRL